MTHASVFPAHRGRMEYFCLGCDAVHGVDELLYTCPQCGAVLLLRDAGFDQLKKIPAQEWRDKFDARAASKIDALRGVFRFYELLAPVMEAEDVVHLGEGNTPVVPASDALQQEIGARFAFKNDGQNPSASFKDRGMACAFSYLRTLIRKHGWDQVLTVCASTGDTSASAALYAAYCGGPVTSVVILPQGKVTPQQLAQPLGNGAVVLEVPGVFDDCMKVVEHLADNYRVALLNSKNAWRILGQESYAFEVAQWRDWNVEDLCVFAPIGNAGNVTAIMAGFLKLFELGIIEGLPRIFGVQSEHADPVYRYYAVNDPRERKWEPVQVQPSVAQAAMIGDPVSFPRVRHFAERFEAERGREGFQVVQVREQDIIEGMLTANARGHIACTQGGECLAGLRRALELGLVSADETSVLDATAHHLKFIEFQQMYFENRYPPSYGIEPRQELANAPEPVIEPGLRETLSREEYAAKAAERVVARLGLDRK
jgi:threonine synthase